MLARDVMTAPVITARENATIVDIVDLMLKHRISAVPIVDADRRLVGIVSEGDLIQKDMPGRPSNRSWWLTALGSQASPAQDFNRVRHLPAAEIMTRNVVTAHSDTPLWQIAETLERRRLKRMPIVDDGRPVGIVSRANLLQALTAQKAAIADHPTPDDRSLRGAVIEAITASGAAGSAHFNAVVKDATAYLWGDVDSDENRDALIAAAHGVAGIRAVVDHMHVHPVRD